MTNANVLVWGVLLVWALAGLLVRWVQARRARATSSTEPAVSRNRNLARTGPKWEQDEPYPECFEQEDDL